MAVLLGFIAASNIGGTNSPYVSNDVRLGGTVAEGQIGASPINAYTSNLPVSSDAAGAIQGFIANSYLLDFYYRIHYSDFAFDLGNVITTTARQVLVWNAYLSPRTLGSIDTLNADGITVSGPVTPPASVPGLKEYTFDVIISTDGPPVIDATITWNWIDANDAPVALIGSRITAWVWRPNWTRGITERLSWLTDVIRGYDGTEQRIKARKTPRRTFEFEYLVEGAMRRKFEAALWDWQARVWSLPIWTDGQTLSAPVAAGAAAIDVITTDRDYAIGGFAILIDLDTGEHEVVEILTIASNQIGLKRPTEKSWATGKWIYPAKPARLSEQHKLSRFTGDHAGAIAVFNFTDSSDWPAATEATTYRGYPVFASVSNGRAEMTEDYQRRLKTIDSVVGKWSVDDTTGITETTIGHLWSATSRAEIAALRSWLYARKGRLTMFWRPTGLVDLLAAQTITDTAMSIDIEWVGYTKYYQVDKNRRDIRIELTNGTVFHRRITSAVEVDATTERIGIDTALGVTATPAEIARISFMVLRRLDTDTLDIAWWTGDVADCQFPMRSLNNDV
jgi:hypothetical protein